MTRILAAASAILGAAMAAGMLARASDDTPLKFRCMVKDAQILQDRTHVRCANRGLNGLSEFAAETNQPYANQVAAAVVQALRTGTTLVITYAPSDELNPDGCNRQICRKIIEVGGPAVLPKPPALQPLPASSAEPSIEPDDFDPVDETVNEPDTAAVVRTPPPKPVAQPFKMRPIPD